MNEARRRLTAGRVNVGHDDFRALARKSLRGHAAQAPRRAGDERDLAGKSLHRDAPEIIAVLDARA